MKELVVAVYKKYLQNLKCNVKKGKYFSFNFGWCSIHQLDHAHYRGVGVFLLNRQNLLKVTKGIC